MGADWKWDVGSQLRCELTGVKGRRTKYQTFDTSQLIVSADRWERRRVVTRSTLDEGQVTTATDIVVAFSLALLVLHALLRQAGRRGQRQHPLRERAGVAGDGREAAHAVAALGDGPDPHPVSLHRHPQQQPQARPHHRADRLLHPARSRGRLSLSSRADAPGELDRLQLLAAAQVLRGLREQPHQGARHSAAAGAGGPAEQRDHAAPLQQGGQQEQRAGVGASDGGFGERVRRSTSTARATRRSGR